MCERKEAKSLYSANANVSQREFLNEIRGYLNRITYDANGEGDMKEDADASYHREQKVLEFEKDLYVRFSRSLKDVWRKFSEVTYGYIYDDAFRKTYKPLYLSISEKNGKYIVDRKKETFEIFETRIGEYYELPTFSRQPIIYIHHIERDDPELLWFDSTDTLFSFARIRGYSDEDGSQISIGRERNYIEITDKTRKKDENGSKTYRYGYIPVKVLPNVFYYQKPVKRKESEELSEEEEVEFKDALVRVDYRIFIYNKEFVEDRFLLFDKYLEALPFFKKEPNQKEEKLNIRLLNYLPYLFLVLSMRIYGEVEQLPSNWREMITATSHEGKTSDEYVADIEKTLKKVSNCFVLSSKEFKRLSVEWIRYLLLWTSKLEKEIKILQKKAWQKQDTDPFWAGIKKELDAVSISEIDNFRLLVACLPSEIISTLFEDLFPIIRLRNEIKKKLDLNDNDLPNDVESELKACLESAKQNPRLNSLSDIGIVIENILHKEEQMYLAPDTE